MHKVIHIKPVGGRTEYDLPTLGHIVGSFGLGTALVVNGRAGSIVLDEGNEYEFVESDEDFRHFRFDRLPEHLKVVSRHFYDVAEWMVLTLPVCRQRTIALQQLRVAKDAAVRVAKDAAVRARLTT